MTALKAHQIEAFLRRPDPDARLALIYGPDPGLVSERALALQKVAGAASGADLDDPFSVVRLDGDELGADPGRLVDEATTVALFGGKRLIRVQRAESAAIAKAAAALLEVETLDAFVILEAGDLKKTNPVRKIAEAHERARALPCYADTAQSIEDLIEATMRAAHLSLEPEAAERLAGQLGANRLISRGELDKLVLYAGADTSTVTLEMVDAVVGDESALQMDKLVDAAGLGDIDAVDRTLRRFELSGMAAAALLTMATRHFQNLHRARADMDATGRSAQRIVDAMRPPVFFQRKAKMQKQLSLWTLKGLDRALERLDEATLMSRTMTPLGHTAAAAALIAIAAVAAHQARSARA